MDSVNFRTFIEQNNKSFGGGNCDKFKRNFSNLLKKCNFKYYCKYKLL